MKKYKLFIRTIVVAVVVAVIVLINFGYFAGSTFSGKYCIVCHEIRSSYQEWSESTHRKIQCKKCHGSALSFNLRFHFTNFNRLLVHMRGDIPDRIMMLGEQTSDVASACRDCHEGNYSLWRAGGHSMSYNDVFLNEKENRKILLNQDCMRCHGMFFNGSIEDIVTPIDTVGPWKLADKSLAGRPAINCLSCHEMHTVGQPVQPPDYAEPGLISYSREMPRYSLGFYDCRENRHFGIDILPLPEMSDSGVLVKMSKDKRQTVCYQCHAPQTSFEVGTGDDRTPVGVHEGVSCLGCHDAHSLDARASCDNCHPKMSNCGLDVESMNTTFKTKESPYDIHFVKCKDCHPEGVEKSSVQLLNLR